MSEPETREQTWVYGGRRWSPSGPEAGKILHAWYPSPEAARAIDDPLLFGKLVAFVIGGLYTVRAGEREDGTVVAAGSSPAWTQDRVEDRETQAALEALDRAAQVRSASARLHRKALADSALDEALAPLIEIASKMRTHADRAAFTSYVVRQLGSGW